MTSVTIGIAVQAEPDQLRTTLESLRANTPPGVALILLPDGPDAAVQTLLAELPHPQLATAQARGMAACFNRLAAVSKSDVVVLLESGSVVGQFWLDGLLTALAADPRHGLAGPSTNASWNEQNLLRYAAIRPMLQPSAAHGRRPAPVDVDRIAEVVRQRFGSAVQGLEPLHSLADFCYAVRREVVRSVGAADEAYGTGPCWEMDYNIRAARAGFRGLWACGSYVHRMGFTTRRTADETALMEANKRRYQDKFCARQLRGAQTAYEPHCRGEACADFAPADLIGIHTPLPANASVSTVHAIPSAGTGLVSCIMATANRQDFVLQSIRYFQRQDYPAKELIILDDENGEDLTPLLPGDDRLRYVRLPPGLSIGEKRNRGCALARGRFIAQWDDDDWYTPTRLTAQLAPLLTGTAQISALTAGVFFDLERWEFWRVSAPLHKRMFVADVHGGTLVFHRSLIDQGLCYPNRSLAEDAWVLWQAMRSGARLAKLQGDSLFVYLRHCTASWTFRCGKFLDPSGWQRVAEPDLLAADRSFYALRSPAIAPATPMIARAAAPLVTCIMPTAGRRRFARQAIAYFQRQDYNDRELLIVDDGDEPVADLLPDDRRVRYHRLPSGQSLGAKRNIACAQAQGEVILHWDDDDWMSPRRISHQVEALLAHPETGVCGLASLYFFNPGGWTAWWYSQPMGARAWVSGNTLCYLRSVWERHRFPDINEGEDTLFVWSLAEREILKLAKPDFFVGVIHAGNTSPKRTLLPGWQSISPRVIASLMQGDEAFYEGLAGSAARVDALS